MQCNLYCVENNNFHYNVLSKAKQVILQIQ